MPSTLHDFGGFPRQLFDVRYPAPGDPVLAARVRDLLAPVEIGLDMFWGLDHGTWSVLVHAFPQADIPVIQLSIDAMQPASFHYNLAAQLAPSRAQGVLIMGSGNVVHLGQMQWTTDAIPYDWAVCFNEKVRACLISQNHASLMDIEALDVEARAYAGALLALTLHHRPTGSGQNPDVTRRRHRARLYWHAYGSRRPTCGWAELR